MLLNDCINNSYNVLFPKILLNSWLSLCAGGASSFFLYLLCTPPHYQQLQFPSCFASMWHQKTLSLYNFWVGYTHPAVTGPFPLQMIPLAVLYSKKHDRVPAFSQFPQGKWNICGQNGERMACHSLDNSTDSFWKERKKPSVAHVNWGPLQTDVSFQIIATLA